MAQYSDSWLQFEAASGGRVTLTGDASEMRNQFAGLYAALAPNYPPAPDAVSVMNGSHEGIKYRVYFPKNAGKLLPVGVYTHGGGFVLGDLDTEDMLCQAFVEQAETILVSVDYRLAPEHPHPAQLNDTIKILEWAHHNADSFGGDANRFYTIGASAGASLALMSAREIMSGRTSVAPGCLQGVVAIGPFTVHPDHVPQEYQTGYSSYIELGDTAPIISRAVMDRFFRCANLDADKSDGFILLHKDDFRQFPPVYVATAGCDPLRDDGKILAAALRNAGVEADSGGSLGRVERLPWPMRNHAGVGVGVRARVLKPCPNQKDESLPAVDASRPVKIAGDEKNDAMGSGHAAGVACGVSTGNATVRIAPTILLFSSQAIRYPPILVNAGGTLVIAHFWILMRCLCQKSEWREILNSFVIDMVNIFSSVNLPLSQCYKAFNFDDEPSESMDLAGVSMAPQLPSEEDVRYCIRWYTRATNCVFDLFSYNELVEKVIPWLGDKRPSASKSCINFLVLAIGAQCGPRDMEREANAYFMHGRYLAMSQFFDKPRIVTVQIYALLAMYLLNASRRNAASMHLSVAVRTAYALGIHRPDATALFSATEASFRERVWKVLRILDLFLSTSLGHSPSTAETRDTGSQRGYSASNDLCYIFEKILCELYEKQEVQPSALHHVSTHHREWAARFHEGLQVDHISADEYVGDEPGSKQLNIGLLHLKEAYYWTIMLCSFPYLLELVQRRITNFSDPLPLPATNNVCAELLPQRDTLLAHASVNSAVLTIVLLRGLLHAREIPKRLPFVVNSVFTSCLVLGASFFADLDCVFPVEETLLTAEKLLGLFQQHDSLARRELSIVRSLRSACNEFVKQRHERWLKHQGVLIQGLFGDIKSRQTNTRESSRSCSSVQTPLSMGGIGLTTRGLSRENFLSLQSPNHIQLESNAIWDDLFGDNAPIHLCGSDIQQTEAGAQLMNMSEEVDFPSSLSFLAGDEAAGLRSAGAL
ncbi:hypothetical protein CNMCM5793_009109 [Aspergillus hiratsukae]|uniref:Xylanolytic transcriptional activator regulatory domain-containing protein n=1 Tax=Aspergillus hiratsukae TaxID=1194566 RepID=A0A8H6PZH4_9EURO|nr:hypothetical protein CNMCM5793_009109 [Aspergillus hiratsukae]KAF7163232.1 hypothetical protein CNMCM6106_000220 [Aspergillus hiratsukae]